MNDFLLINGHGIFPKNSIKKVVPMISVYYELNTIPPATSLESFTFELIKNTNIELEFSHAEGKAEELFVDDTFTKNVRETISLSEEQILEVLYGEEVDSKVKSAIKNYKRRLLSFEEYQQKVTIINANPEAPDYQANLAAISREAPDSETLDKQEASLNKIKKRTLETLTDLTDREDGDTEREQLEERLNSVFDSSEEETVKDQIDMMLRVCYAVNFDERNTYNPSNVIDSSEDADEGETDSRFEAVVDRDVERANEVLGAETTIRNSPDFDEEDSPAESGEGLAGDKL